MSVTITQTQAANIAKHIRQMTAERYIAGTLDKFSMGLMHGHLNTVSCYMDAEDWIIEGIRNEINYMCDRAGEARST